MNRKSGSLIKFAGHAFTIIQRVTCEVRCAQMNTVEVYGVAFFLRGERADADDGLR